MQLGKCDKCGGEMGKTTNQDILICFECNNLQPYTNGIVLGKVPELLYRRAYVERENPYIIHLPVPLGTPVFIIKEGRGYSECNANGCDFKVIELVEYSLKYIEENVYLTRKEAELFRGD